MGLQLTLPKTKNQMYFDFENAYWAIDNVLFSYEIIDFSLIAYPSREAKLHDRMILVDPSVGFGGPAGAGSVSCALYQWHVTMALTEIFPTGQVPAGRDAQYTALYNWIKAYTGLPFTDVLEA